MVISLMLLIIHFFALNNNGAILKYVSGGSIGEKYNNIQTRIFKDITPINRSQLIVLLKD